MTLSATKSKLFSWKIENILILVLEKESLFSVENGSENLKNDNQNVSSTEQQVLKFVILCIFHFLNNPF